MITTILLYARNLTWKGWLAVGAGALIVLLIATLTVNGIKDRFSESAQVRENNQDRVIRDELSEKRFETETDISNEERLLNEELNKLPDSLPSNRRLLRACRELRDNGHSKLPSECGPYTS